MTAAISSYGRSTFPLGHSGMTVSRYYITHLFGALLPFTAGLVMFGWRAALAVAAVMLPAAGCLYIWRKVGLRGGQLRYAHVLWFSFALSLMLPAHLLTQLSLERAAYWPILSLAGSLLVMFCWVLGGLGSGRIHPVVVTYLVISVLYGTTLIPHYVLQRNCTVLGDLLVTAGSSASATQDPWLRRPIIPGGDSIIATPASESLGSFTTGQVSPERVWLSLEGLLRDRLPPLEDLILGAHPGPIGASSAIAVIIGGLFLIYRGLIDYRIPIIIVFSSFIAFLILPVPAVITDHPEWRWAVGHIPGIGWSMGVTFANYEILASPLLFMAFFLATAPAVRPMARRGRAVFSILIGILAAIFQLYVSVSFGSYLALLTASLTTPAIDKWIRPHVLV